MDGERDQHGSLRFGAGDQEWSAPDPTAQAYADAMHFARYPPPDRAPNYRVADIAETYAYLVVGCPTTELAVEKLREIRAAIRRNKEPR